MYILVIFAFLGEISGETYFYCQEKGNLTLSCSKSAANDSKKRVWYVAENSLETFCLINCSSEITAEYSSEDTRRYWDLKCVSDQLSFFSLQRGGVFACGAILDEKESKTRPLFSNVTHCRHYNFFMVVIINQTAENNVFVNSTAKLETDLTIEEGKNITLSCGFQMRKPEQVFVMYWIKSTDRSECLFSVSYTPPLSYNTHCCVDEKIKNRVLNNTVLDEKHVVNNLTILNVTYSDNGTYLCVVNAWSQGKHVWRTASKVYLQGRKTPTPSSYYMPVYATTGVIVGIIFVIGLACLISKKKIKLQGTPSAHHARDQGASEVPGDECSPYAMSCSNDMQCNEMPYSLVTSSFEGPNGASTMTNSSTASDTVPANEIHTVYALANK
ncbi:uncharacterized protein LOC112550110 isoform X1 [Alligator sinensis]|uniref:Uncharacterized protein LOC112550110 isoform X1 n=1 Tax=Alligator sinensis TaxID=38654 RepID=A0A3Q0GK91_ALLSI|nr:uncharacterized protein LOC112550110 isoform X1 [Alligator sinensis]